MSHSYWMGLALEAAEDVRFNTAPRPWVGCAIVTEQSQVFKGATDGRHGPHAEQVALAAAGEQARGATLYVTLEPCSHQGQTPPCAQDIIQAGIAQVVVALTDPDPKVNGQGIRQLTDAGIDVKLGVGAPEATRQLQPYLTQRQHHRPFVTLKLALTLDGRVALPDGTSQWLTGTTARADAHLLRAEADAVLVGAGTARRDNPSLTVRNAALPLGLTPKDVQPQRLVLGQIPAGSKLLEASPEKNLAPATELSGELPEILTQLAAQGIVSLLVEGGPTVARAFHEAQLIDRYVFYLAPALAGGNQGLPVLEGSTATSMAELWRGELMGVQLLGEDLRVELRPHAEISGPTP